MYKIEDVKVTDLDESKYLKLQRIHYKQENIAKTWDITQAHDSVAILLYREDSNEFILVKQFRPAIYLQNEDGFTYELCAGIVDKDKSLKEIAKEEILEECGYDIDLDRIEKITSFHTSVGFAGARQSLFFAKVNESDIVSAGGGIENEMIELVYLPIKEIKKFVLDENYVKTPGLMFAIHWFLEQKLYK